MKNILTSALNKATQLTREQNLAEATRVLMRALTSSGGAARRSRPRMPSRIPRPSVCAARSARRWSCCATPVFRASIKAARRLSRCERPQKSTFRRAPPMSRELCRPGGRPRLQGLCAQRRRKTANGR